MDITEDQVDRITASMLHNAGIPANLTGYQYVKKAIILVYNDSKLINAITKELYPEVAKVFGTTPSRAERAIRHAIEVAWDRGDMDTLQMLFGYTVSYEKGKPTNSEFIALMAEQLKFKIEDICRKH